MDESFGKAVECTGRRFSCQAPCRRGGVLI
jgi:hypothetical protein